MTQCGPTQKNGQTHVTFHSLHPLMEIQIMQSDYAATSMFSIPRYRKVDVYAVKLYIIGRTRRQKE